MSEGLVVGVAAARLRPLKLGRPLKHRQAIVAGTTLDNAMAMAVTKQVPPALKNRWLGRVAARVALERPAGRFGRGSCHGAFEPLRLGRPLKHRQAIVAGTTLDNVRAMAVTKHDKAGSTPPVVPGAAPALAKAGVGGYIYIYI